jgi:uroporphyrinogen-III synthase
VLDGFTIGVTADRRADEQVALFERRGATVVHGAAIRTLPVGDDEGVVDVTRTLIAHPPDALIANTGLGMRSWIGVADSHGLGEPLLQALRSSRICARGPKAAGAVHSLGLDVAAVATTERLRECVELVAAELPAGGRLAIQLDGGGSPAEVDVLRRAGAEVVEVPVYRWEPPDDPRPAQRLAEAVASGRVHAVTFTSAPALRTWLDLAEEAGVARPLRARLRAGEVVVGCVGPVCIEAAEEAGIGGGDVVAPARARLGPLVAAVSERLTERVQRVGPLVITGTVVHSGERRVELSDIEARTLAVLAERPGAVVAKADLLRQVWGDPGGDPHVVEVTVARLRRRLGPDGRGIVTVPRRGYTLR